MASPRSWHLSCHPVQAAYFQTHMQLGRGIEPPLARHRERAADTQGTRPGRGIARAPSAGLPKIPVATSKPTYRAPAPRPRAPARISGAVSFAAIAAPLVANSRLALRAMAKFDATMQPTCSAGLEASTKSLLAWPPKGVGLAKRHAHVEAEPARPLGLALPHRRQQRVGQRQALPLGRVDAAQPLIEFRQRRGRGCPSGGTARLGREGGRHHGVGGVVDGGGGRIGDELEVELVAAEGCCHRLRPSPAR